MRHNLIETRLLLAVALLLCGLLVGASPVFAAPSGGVISTATSSNATPSIGEQITVTIRIDMSGVSSPDNKLGSYTGTLDWNRAVLSYHSNSGVPAGFTGVVNTNNAATGHVIFNGANAGGATGSITILTITFNVAGAGTSPLNLEYTSMAAAATFANLLTILTVTDGQVVVGGATQQHVYLPCVLKIR